MHLTAKVSERTHIGHCLLGTRWYTDPECHNARRYRQMDRRADGRHDNANNYYSCYVATLVFSVAVD